MQRRALAFFFRGQDGDRESRGFQEGIQSGERCGVGMIVKDAHFDFYIFQVFSRAEQGIDAAQAVLGHVDAGAARACVDIALVAHAGA
jgi:hypothetical protein